MIQNVLYDMQIKIYQHVQVKFYFNFVFFVPPCKLHSIPFL